MIAMKEQDRSVFYEGDAFLLGFNPYMAPGENQVHLLLLGLEKTILGNIWKLDNTITQVNAITPVFLVPL